MPSALAPLPEASCVVRKAAHSAFPRESCGCVCLLPGSPLPSAHALVPTHCEGSGAGRVEAAGSHFPYADPVSRKNVKSAHSTRNRYSSQWTLTKCQASTPARTLTSDWRTVGSQHGVTVTESDSYSASLSQDTGEPGPRLVLLLLAQLRPPFSHPLPAGPVPAGC